jgi:UDP-4-amino-4,6-dideoxy-N-acetyl-beta-L-altrosamine transaminase
MTLGYARHSIDEGDIAAVISVLRGERLTQGPVVEEFERAVADYCGAAHAIAVNSCTSALHAACLALGVAPGTRVWTTPITFVATANAALMCGAEVDFVDIDPESWNISVAALERQLLAAKAAGRLPHLVIPVHLCGASCEMSAVAELGREYGFRILEDAAHALGGSYDGKPVGSCAHSDVAVFSFHAVKSITTGEGGMALTNDADLARTMRLLRSHGRNDSGEQELLGYNYRLSDIQAALGNSQLRRLDSLVARRRAIALRYDSMLAGSRLALQRPATGVESAHHLHVVRVPEAGGATLRQALEREGIFSPLHYPPVQSRALYRSLGFDPARTPEAEKYGNEAVTLPLYPGLTEEQQDRVIAVVRSAV